jgi:hypothetical protein
MQHAKGKTSAVVLFLKDLESTVDAAEFRKGTTSHQVIHDAILKEDG